MAKIYAPPRGFDVPGFDTYFVNGHFDSDLMVKSEQEYLERFRVHLTHGKDDPYIGQNINFPHADGYAHYVVNGLNPASLIFVAFGDAYRLPEAHERGLTAKDIKAEVDRAKLWRELLAKKGN